MALETSFITTCKSAVSASPEYTAFTTAYAGFSTAGRPNRIAAWHAVYTDSTGNGSVVNDLRLAIRRTVNAQADSSGALGPLDREEAVRQLNEYFIPDIAAPATDAEENAAFQAALVQELLSR